MGGLFNILRSGTTKHRIMMLVGIVALALVAAGCAQSGSVPPPSGPIGGGCG